MLGAAFAFSIPALSYHASCPRWLLGAGVLVVAVDIVSIVFGRQVMEWITVALILFYVGAVAAGTRRL